MLRRLLIVGIAVFPVSLVLAIVAQQRAQASVFESLLGFGERMAPYLDDGRTTEQPRAIVLNGQPLYVAVGRTPHQPGRVQSFYLDRYTRGHEALAQIARAQKSATAAPPTAVTFGDDDHGGLVAFDLGSSPTIEDLAGRYVAFARTHRLGELGQIRFVRWQREPDGGTRFLSLWTDRRFSLDGLLPPPGRDVAGGDLPDVPRPPGMTRVLALEEVGKPYRTRVYEGRGQVSQIAATLGFALRQRGWVEDRAYGHRDPDSQVLRFDRQGRTVVLGIDVAEQGLVEVAEIESSGGGQ